MNLRIGDPETDAQASSVRPRGTMGRTRSAVSDAGDNGDLTSPSGQGVVVRLSPDARKLLARHDDERAGRSSPDGGAPDTSRAPTSADAGATLGTASSKDAPAATGGGSQAGDDKTAGDKTAAGQTAGKSGSTDKGAVLTPEQKEVVSKLASRDVAVRAHEAAHQAVAGALGGAASFSYETGPDGRRYAVGGEVPVTLRPGRTPQETIANAQTVRSAALAPADPSSEDLAVAAQASQVEAQAQQEITQDRVSDRKDATTGSTPQPRVRRGTGGGERTVGAASPGQPRALSASGHLDGDEADGDTAAVSPASSNAVPAVDGGDRDPLMVFSTLKSERSISSGGFYGHLHSSGDGCAICARAAARYA